jgi:CheY-like chemotaxis protein
MKILIVDDSKVNLMMVSKMLESLGNKVLTANNGYEAINVIEKNIMIDLVLLDWYMPIMSGLDFLKKNSVESIFDIPVVIMITDEDSKKISIGIKNGAIDYISKPFTSEMLEKKLNELFSYSA